MCFSKQVELYLLKIIQDVAIMMPADDRSRSLLLRLFLLDMHAMDI